MSQLAYHRRVMPHVGSNPIARAVAQRKFEVALRDQKIRLLMSDDGEPADEFIAGVDLTLRVIALSAEHDPHTAQQNAERVGAVLAGVAACEQVIKATAYSTELTGVLVNALQSAAELNRVLDVDAVNVALHELKVLN